LEECVREGEKVVEIAERAVWLLAGGSGGPRREITALCRADNSVSEQRVEERSGEKQKSRMSSE
jgi:hypothetical protein